VQTRRIVPASRSLPACRSVERKVFSYYVKALRQFGAALLLLLSCAAPVMACLAPDARMTAEERACCRVMSAQCGQMAMPASHDCCTKAPNAVLDGALKSNTVQVRPDVCTVSWVASLDVLTVLVQEQSSQGWIQSPQHWPPKSPPAAITVLRI
jgi:hypothetical protein